ncbi:Hsp20/alpha crystallin family protein [Methanospirillum stamsii]|uniref:Hsp20/alpha crystallin family protein n=1 Tax=Methanospirillum stamsii TaxID=1277351 RepID=A0A2V2NHS5_9EURY|nr:Hsp20/alpha crystallin family protein [Methanospirillum stamsii]PWR75957.1 Hsp20/alpha crystallin family protein [Methanospirillum stamsii]
MTKQYYEYIFEELEYMKNYMDALFQQIQEASPIALLPASHDPERKLLPGVQDNLKVNITEYEDEIVITAEMIPGDLKRDIKIDLIHPLALKISCVRREWKKEEKMEYSMLEHSFGYISQIVPLPKPVDESGSKALYKNGVLEVHLKKSEPDTKKEI